MVTACVRSLVFSFEKNAAQMPLTVSPADSQSGGDKFIEQEVHPIERCRSDADQHLAFGRYCVGKVNVNENLWAAVFMGTLAFIVHLIMCFGMAGSLVLHVIGGLQGPSFYPTLRSGAARPAYGLAYQRWLRTPLGSSF